MLFVSAWVQLSSFLAVHDHSQTAFGVDLPSACMAWVKTFRPDVHTLVFGDPEVSRRPGRLVLNGLEACRPANWTSHSMLSCTSPWFLATLLSKLSAADSCGGVPAPQDQEPRSQIQKSGDRYHVLAAEDFVEGGEETLGRPRVSKSGQCVL